MASVNLTIDGKAIVAESGQTVMEAATAAGIDIPSLCNHPALAPIGACRICLVEIEKQRGLQPACTFQVSDGMVVHTESPQVVETRKFLLELLFSERNHYCMYCQMSGDCELQSLAYRYGLDSWLYPRPYTPLAVDASRQHFVMDHNRCVLCRRCIRACQELVGNYTLGLGGRGADSMIVADMNVPFGNSSCISCGTCLQVCPTGALMDRRSAYRGREEQVDRTKSTCLACSLGCGVEIVSRDNQILRIEGDWDSDNAGVLCVAGRFDILEDKRKRVTKPMVRQGDKLQEVTWDEALQVAADKLKAADSVAGLASPRASNEALNRFADVLRALNAQSVSSTAPVPDFMGNVEGVLSKLDTADLYIVVGADLRQDHRVAGIVIQRSVMNRGARLVIVNDEPTDMDFLTNYTFSIEQVDKAIQLAEHAEQPLVVYGAQAGPALPKLRAALTRKASFLGLVPGTNTRGALAAKVNDKLDGDGLQTAYVMAADDAIGSDVLDKLSRADFVIAQTSYLGPLVECADVVLPTAIWAEKSGTITNTEGRVLPIQAAARAPAGVKQDEEILTALAAKLD